MWKNALISAFLKGMTYIGLPICTLSVAHAQTSTSMVRWELQILQNDQLVDSFSATTPTGQPYNATHRYLSNAQRYCAKQLSALKDQASSAENNTSKQSESRQTDQLSRTITVTPNDVAPPSITFMLEAQEMLEPPRASSSPNCQHLPEPRLINANHPSFKVNAGEWASWPILDKKPRLTYRLRAHIVTP